MTNVRAAGPLRAALALAIVMLSSCGPAEPLPKVYVLGDPVPSASSTVSQLGDPVVELQQIRVPDYLDTTDIVTRHPDGQVVASPSARWGERLSVGITRALAAALAKRLPGFAIITSPPPDVPRFQVLIDIDSFESQPGKPCVLAGRWRVLDGRSGRAIADQRISLATPAGTGDADLVAAMTREVDLLAGQIASALAAGAAP